MVSSNVTIICVLRAVTYQSVQMVSNVTIICVLSSAENCHPNLNRLIGRFNERSSILDRSLSHSKHVTMNLG